MKRTVFFISDGTGITATTLGRSLITQFEKVEFEEVTIPYVNDLTKVEAVLQAINAAFERDQQKPIVFTTLINQEIHARIQQSPAVVMDFFSTFIGPLEKELQQKSSHTVGRTHGLKDYNDYMIRINAVNYTLACDDGANLRDYDKADIILVGVSRCGKTPTSLYLALQFGLHTANYPFTSDELVTQALPKALQSQRAKIFGLTISAERLRQIREERRPDSEYASMKTCVREINEANALFHQLNIPYLDTTTRSIEEIAAEIVAITGVKRRLY
ncbi:MAG: pyruvate, water dikinase regulatory protein [Gammaproteobacteria bacterium]